MMWKIVKKIDFFKTIGWLDVHPHIPAWSKYPYTSIWKLRDGRILGKTITHSMRETEFFLSAAIENYQGLRYNFSNKKKEAPPMTC